MKPRAAAHPAPGPNAAFTSAPVEEEEKVVLRCCDGEEFAVAASVAKKCGTISNMIDDDCVEGGVPLPNYLNKKHSGGGAFAAVEVKEFEKAFFEKMTKEALFDVILAANYLHAEKLLDAAMVCVADRIMGKTVPELREYFGIEIDFTPEEEEEIRKENS
ncbi:hypothetical protein SETIT_3G254200v2 [Setaria italica]|uniref:SKP1-like protein n=1 Tax=Setaria italica TaxID=4555 RepID=K3ZCJ6_SETIT|nr:hypothetical protein SETIT_3G254200v2 [Setaria italica]